MIGCHTSQSTDPEVSNSSAKSGSGSEDAASVVDDPAVSSSEPRLSDAWSVAVVPPQADTDMRSAAAMAVDHARPVEALLTFTATSGVKGSSR